MAVKSLIESPVSSSEEESSSQEDHQLKKREPDSVSDQDDSEEENSDPKSISVSKKSTEKAQEADDSGSEETDSEAKQSGGDSDPKLKSISEISTENFQEEDGSGSEYSDEEESGEPEDLDRKPKPVGEISTEKVQEEESEKKSYDVKEGNKEPHFEMPSSSANSIKNKTDGGNSKKDLFKRLWTLEDEKKLLISMLQFRSEEGKEVDSSSLEHFCDFLKGRLSFTDKPKRRQVSHKIKVLKKKYSADTRFTKEHDLNMKKIASQVWEIDVKYKSLKRKFSSSEEEVGKSKLFSLKKKLETGGNVEKEETLEEKIQKQKMLEIKMELKRMDLISETFGLILEVSQK